MTPPLAFDAVVFDFDGTLARLNIDFAHMRRVVLEWIAQNGLDPADFSSLFVLEMIDAAAGVLRASGTGDAERFHGRAHELIREIEIAAARDGSLFAQSRPTLDILRRDGVRTAIVTRNCLASIEILFPDANACCDAVVTRDDTPRVKPDPGHLLLTLQRLAASPRRSVMTGDHPMDIRTGKDLGTKTVGVLSGCSDGESLRKAGADAIVADVSAIPALLPRLSGNPPLTGVPLLDK